MAFKARKLGKWFLTIVLIYIWKSDSITSIAHNIVVLLNPHNEHNKLC